MTVGFPTGEGGRTLKRTLLAALAGAGGVLAKLRNPPSSDPKCPLCKFQIKGVKRLPEMATAAGVLSH